MSETGHQRAILDSLELYLGEKAKAARTLQRIKAGATFHEACGDGDLQDVTQERADTSQKTIRNMDGLIIANEILLTISRMAAKQVGATE